MPYSKPIKLVIALGLVACSSKSEQPRTCWLYHPSLVTPNAATKTTMFAWQAKGDAELASNAIARKDRDSYVAIAQKGQKFPPRTRATVRVDGVGVIGVDVAVNGATQRVWVLSDHCLPIDAQFLSDD